MGQTRASDGYLVGRIGFESEGWRDVDHVEIGTAEWVVWFNTERPHELLDDLTPELVEKLHYDHRRALPEAG